MKKTPTCWRAVRFLISAGTLTATLTACVVPQREDPAAKPIVTQSLGLAGQSYRGVDDEWWKSFGDPQLDRMMASALGSSPTLTQALARVRAAKARAAEAGSDYSPKFAADVDETWQRLSENYYVPPPYGGTKDTIGQATSGLTWGLDFWGKQAALIQSAHSQLVASELDAAAARLALSGAVAQAYVDLYRAWALINIATRSEAQRAELLHLTEQRVAAGLDTQVELKTAQAALPQAHAALLRAQSQRDLAGHRLMALTGSGAADYAQIARPSLDPQAALPLPDELPLDLLDHRPDVLAARARIGAATAGRAAARADFYPDVNLKAFVGVQSIGLDRLLQSGSVIYGAGPTVHMPLIESARLRAAYSRSTADLDAAVASYNSTVLDAVRETSDQMTLNASLRQQIDSLDNSSQLADSAYELARKRYAAGLASQLVVLRAESQVLDARRELVMATSDSVLARVRLLLMLGGSFQPPALVASGLASESSRHEQ